MIVDAGLDAVISAFIRNPELSSIQYKANQKDIVMEMILTENIDCNKQQLFLRRTTAALKMLQQLRGKKPLKLSMEFCNQGNINILTLCRDAHTLTEEEIDLYVKLAGLEFSHMLLRETDGSILQNNVINDIKKRLLQNINPKKERTNNIFAYRDRGKMFVYDK